METSRTSYVRPLSPIHPKRNESTISTLLNYDMMLCIKNVFSTSRISKLSVTNPYPEVFL